jgi:hypothetical protein
VVGRDFEFLQVCNCPPFKDIRFRPLCLLILLQVCMNITESLLLLAPAEMLALQGQSIASLLVLVLGDSGSTTSNVRDDGTIMALEVVETLLTVQPAGGVALLEAAGLAQKVVAMALGGQESSLVTAQLLCVLARICAADSSLFLSLVGKIGPALPVAGGDVVACFVAVCVERIDSLMLPTKRKVVATALVNLVGTGRDCILQQLGDIVNVVVEVMHQEQRDQLLPGQAMTAAQVNLDNLLRIFA